MEMKVKKWLPIGLSLFTPWIVFNAIAFICAENYDANFWCGYIFITISWICATVSVIATEVGNDTGGKPFLNSPLMLVSSVYFIIQLVFGIAVMAIPRFNLKAAVIVQLLILMVYIGVSMSLQLYKGKNASKETSRDTSRRFHTQLLLDLEDMKNRCVNKALRCKVVALHDAVKYSDPISSVDTLEYEERIEALLTAVRGSIYSDDIAVACAECDEISMLIKQRAAVCAATKKH